MSKVWLEELPCSVMICDKNYKILYMNEKSAEDHAKDGGRKMVGTDLMECHPPEAQAKMRKMLASGRSNVYTMQLKRKKKLVYQCQWKKGRSVGGLFQLVFEVPSEIPNIVKD